MPRKPRIDFPGAWHHVMHRGARRAPIFRTDDDGRRFLGEVEEAAGRFGIEVRSRSPMPNHYPPLLEKLPHLRLS